MNPVRGAILALFIALGGTVAYLSAYGVGGESGDVVGSFREGSAGPGVGGFGRVK